MKYQVLMSPNNGQLVIGMPLFRHHEQELTMDGGYSIWVTNLGKPLAYVIHADKLMQPQVFSASWVEENLINLGDL